MVCLLRWGDGGGVEIRAVGIVEEGERGQSGVQLEGASGVGGRALDSGCLCHGHGVFVALVVVSGTAE